MANLKPPVTIEKLMSEWLEDTQIDSTAMEKELIRIPSLHSKYLNIASYHRHIIHQLDKQYKEIKDVKEDYLSGHLNHPEELEKYNLEPIQRILSRPEIARKIEADRDLTKILLKKVSHEEIVEYCTSVLKELNSRTFQLKSYVDYLKYIKGI